MSSNLPYIYFVVHLGTNLGFSGSKKYLSGPFLVFSGAIFTPKRHKNYYR